MYIYIYVYIYTFVLCLCLHHGNDGNDGNCEICFIWLDDGKWWREWWMMMMAIVKLYMPTTFWGWRKMIVNYDDAITYYIYIYTYVLCLCLHHDKTACPF